MSKPYFVKGLIGKVLAYSGLQIRSYITRGAGDPREQEKLTLCSS